MTDLRTRYLGLELRSPLVASAGPLTGDLDDGRAASTTPASAPSCCRRCSRRRSSTRSSSSTARSSRAPSSFAEALDYFPARRHASPAPPTATWRSLERDQGAPSTSRSSPASTRRSPGGWIRYARLIEDAGRRRARAEPLPRRRRPAPTGADDGGQRPRPRRGTSATRSTIPLAVKLSPVLLVARPTSRRGVAAPAPTGWCCSTASTSPTSTSRRSRSCRGSSCQPPWELRLPLRWIAILRPLLGADVSLAATPASQSGTRRGQGAAGRRRRRDDDVGAARATGPSTSPTVEAELRAWMDEHEYDSVDQLRGSVSQATVDDPAAFERANYMQTLRSWTSDEIDGRRVRASGRPVGLRDPRSAPRSIGPSDPREGVVRPSPGSRGDHPQVHDRRLAAGERRGACHEEDPRGV